MSLNYTNYRTDEKRPTDLEKKISSDVACDTNFNYSLLIVQDC